ncbi:MAG: adenylyl-sulfate kinase [Deltaproteobacteria bacterium]|nr:adenylyl-sulfate kinase [Deltaproteobacteria bacterium]MBW2306020.1 adenylyl-sulfate kinase [Deltaproteobacteria bacterium]
MEQKGFTLWFTGLPGSGKTTVSQLVAHELRQRGLRLEVLDGDVVRTNLSKGLGFSKEDRDINIKRIGFVCKLLTRNGIVAIAAAVSPYEEIRQHNRREIQDYFEVFCKCPLEVLIERDPKGMYKKAIAGEIPNFTGISDPYEEPAQPELILHTDREKPEESAARVLRRLAELAYLPHRYEKKDAETSQRDEEIIRRRLEDLGYV